MPKLLWRGTNVYNSVFSLVASQSETKTKMTNT